MDDFSLFYFTKVLNFFNPEYALGFVAKMKLYKIAMKNGIFVPQV